MIKNKVLRLIKIHSKDLERFHLKSIYLFGSVARNEDNEQSDVDVLVDFEGPATFDRFMDLKFYLEGLLQRKVDLVTEAALRSELRGAIKTGSCPCRVISNYILTIFNIPARKF